MELDTANRDMLSFLGTFGAMEIFSGCDGVRRSLIDAFFQLPVLNQATNHPEKLLLEDLSQDIFTALQQILSLSINVSEITTPQQLLDVFHKQYVSEQGLSGSHKINKEFLLEAENESLRRTLKMTRRSLLSMKTLDHDMKNLAEMESYQEYLKSKEREQSYGSYSNDPNDYTIFLHGPQDLSRLLNHPLTEKKNGHLSESELKSEITSEVSSESLPKKGRGRPLGAKNKNKSQKLETQEDKLIVVAKSSLNNGSPEIYEQKENNIDMDSFVQKHIKVLKNIFCPYEFLLTEELWKEEKEKLISEWENELKDLPKVSIAMLVKNIELSLKKCPKDIPDSNYFRQGLTSLLEIASAYPHSFTEPSHLPVNITEIIFDGSAVER